MDLNQECGWRTRALHGNELVPLSASSVPGMGSLSFNSKTGSSFIQLDKHLNYKLIKLRTSSLPAPKLPLKVTVGQGEKQGALTLDCQHPAMSKMEIVRSIFTASIYPCCSSANACNKGTCFCCCSRAGKKQSHFSSALISRLHQAVLGEGQASSAGARAALQPCGLDGW